MAEKPKVLLVEDDGDLNALLKEQLEIFGCEVDSVADGVEAINLAKCGAYSCIISDIRMPNMDGMQMSKELKKMNINIPVIFMTGYSEYTDKEIAQNDGVILLEKPFSIKQLKELFEIYIDVLPKAE